MSDIRDLVFGADAESHGGDTPGGVGSALLGVDPAWYNIEQTEKLLGAALTFDALPVRVILKLIAQYAVQHRRKCVVTGRFLRYRSYCILCLLWIASIWTAVLGLDVRQLCWCIPSAGVGGAAPGPVLLVGERSTNPVTNSHLKSLAVLSGHEVIATANSVARRAATDCTRQKTSSTAAEPDSDASAKDEEPVLSAVIPLPAFEVAMILAPARNGPYEFSRFAVDPTRPDILIASTTRQIFTIQMSLAAAATATATASNQSSAQTSGGTGTGSGGGDKPIVAPPTLICGGDTDGFVDGTGFAARFDQIEGMVMTSDGARLILSDYNNDRVRCVDMKSHAVKTIIGCGGRESEFQSGSGLVASISYPYRVCWSRHRDAAVDNVLYIMCNHDVAEYNFDEDRLWVIPTLKTAVANYWGIECCESGILLVTSDLGILAIDPVSGHRFPLIRSVEGEDAIKDGIDQVSNVHFARDIVMMPGVTNGGYGIDSYAIVADSGAPSDEIAPALRVLTLPDPDVLLAAFAPYRAVMH